MDGQQQQSLQHLWHTKRDRNRTKQQPCIYYSKPPQKSLAEFGTAFPSLRSDTFHSIVYDHNPRQCENGTSHPWTAINLHRGTRVKVYFNAKFLGTSLFRFGPHGRESKNLQSRSRPSNLSNHFSSKFPPSKLPGLFQHSRSTIISPLRYLQKHEQYLAKVGELVRRELQLPIPVHRH